MGIHLKLDIRTSYLSSSPMVVVRNGKNEKIASNNPFIASNFFNFSIFCRKKKLDFENEGEELV